MIHKICKDLILNLRINKFIETGTFLGETIVRVSDWLQDLDPDFGIIADRMANEYLNSFFPERKIYYPIFKDAKTSARTKVYSVDYDREKQDILKNLFSSNPNINFICSSSPEFIRNAIDNRLITDNDNCFFYLDAHWGEYWPLRDEIKNALKLKRSIIVIDDFVVPFYRSFGFDVYNCDPCGWNYIRDIFNNHKIYVYYPKKTDIDKRGIVIIFVGYKKNELSFMKKLPLFSPIIKADPFVTMWFATIKIAKLTLIRLGMYASVRNFLFGKQK